MVQGILVPCVISWTLILFWSFLLVVVSVVWGREKKNKDLDSLSHCYDGFNGKPVVVLVVSMCIFVISGSFFPNLQ